MRLLITLERDGTVMIVAECPSLPGCVSQGTTEAVAIENVREAIKGCLAARKANNL
jgi:predicted RNase H-like HicB family nuclease